MTNEERLKLIDYLLDSDTALDADCFASGSIKELSQENIKEICRLISKIYTITHPVFTGCSHPDWDKENEETYSHAFNFPQQNKDLD